MRNPIALQGLTWSDTPLWWKNNMPVPRQRLAGRAENDRGATRKSGRSLAFLLGTVLGTRLLAVGDALRIEDAADDVIADAGQIAHASAADKDDGVLLQVVPFTRNVGGHFLTIRKPNAGHLAERGVRLLGRHD